MLDLTYVRLRCRPDPDFEDPDTWTELVLNVHHGFGLSYRRMWGADEQYAMYFREITYYPTPYSPASTETFYPWYGLDGVRWRGGGD